MLSLSDCSTEHDSEMNGQFMHVDENDHLYSQDSTNFRKQQLYLLNKS